MATMILLPDGQSGHTFHWSVSGALFHNVALRTDNGDTSYVKCSGANRQLTLTYNDPPVAEAGISSITSVQFLSTGRSTHRSNPALVDISFVTPSAGWSETMSYDPDASSYETLNGTARTYSNPLDVSSAWTYSDLENLSLKMQKNASVEVRVSYLALLVTYETGYGNDVMGVDSGDIANINGIATANISKVNGV